MMNYLIQPSVLQGCITIPPSKSHTLRAILFASLAKGKSIIHNPLSSPDTHAMINACQLLGAHIIAENNRLTIFGTNGKPSVAVNTIIDAGNSGQVLRFITAVAALSSETTVITGDHSISTNRPIAPLINALSKLNVSTIFINNNDYAPVRIKGPLQGGITYLDGEDSQPVSGLLIACAFANKSTTIHVKNPGELPWIDLTLDWFKRLGIAYQQQGYTNYLIQGNAAYDGFEYTVPGDFSSCAFPLVAALITQSEITLDNLNMHDSQGDKEFISILQEMGAIINIDHSKLQIHIKKASKFFGKKINLNNCIDAVPIFAVMSCFAETETIIHGAAIARKKESNRLFAITQELTKLGADIAEHTDGLIIKPSQLTGANTNSHNDHRIAMALTVAGLSAKGKTRINDIECIQKSYPNFLHSLKLLGAKIEVCS